MRHFSQKYLKETLDPSHGDIPLLASCFTTGLLDSTALNNWGVFVAMQTGNTVLLALSTASLPSTNHYATATTLTSLGSFLAGAYLTFFLSRRTNKFSRLFISSSFLAQAILIALAASLTTAGFVPKDPRGDGKQLENIRILTALPPLAFHFGMQIATSRILGFAELPANVLTSSYADLMGDPKLFSLSWNEKRDRRLGSVVLILSGAICAAWMMRKGIEIYVQMWIGAVLKLLVAIGVWLFMEKKKDVALPTGRQSGTQAPMKDISA